MELDKHEVQSTIRMCAVAAATAAAAARSVIARPRLRLSYLVVILTGHHVGEGDLSLEHFPAMHELHQQVADGLELHPLGWFDIRENQTWKYLSKHKHRGRHCQ